MSTPPGHAESAPPQLGASTRAPTSGLPLRPAHAHGGRGEASDPSAHLSARWRRPWSHVVSRLGSGLGSRQGPRPRARMRFRCCAATPPSRRSPGRCWCCWQRYSPPCPPRPAPRRLATRRCCASRRARTWGGSTTQRRTRPAACWSPRASTRPRGLGRCPTCALAATAGHGRAGQGAVERSVEAGQAAARHHATPALDLPREPGPEGRSCARDRLGRGLT